MGNQNSTQQNQPGRPVRRTQSAQYARDSPARGKSVKFAPKYEFLSQRPREPAGGRFQDDYYDQPDFQRLDRSISATSQRGTRTVGSNVRRTPSANYESYRDPRPEPSPASYTPQRAPVAPYDRGLVSHRGNESYRGRDQAAADAWEARIQQRYSGRHEEGEVAPARVQVEVTEPVAEVMSIEDFAPATAAPTPAVTQPQATPLPQATDSKLFSLLKAEWAGSAPPVSAPQSTSQSIPPPAQPNTTGSVAGALASSAWLTPSVSDRLVRDVGAVDSPTPVPQRSPGYPVPVPAVPAPPAVASVHRAPSPQRTFYSSIPRTETNSPTRPASRNVHATPARSSIAPPRGAPSPGVPMTATPMLTSPAPAARARPSRAQPPQPSASTSHAWPVEQPAQPSLPEPQAPLDKPHSPQMPNPKRVSSEYGRERPKSFVSERSPEPRPRWRSPLARDPPPSRQASPSPTRSRGRASPSPTRSASNSPVRARNPGQPSQLSLSRTAPIVPRVKLELLNKPSPADKRTGNAPRSTPVRSSSRHAAKQSPVPVVHLNVSKDTPGNASRQGRSPAGTRGRTPSRYEEHKRQQARDRAAVSQYEQYRESRGTAIPVRAPSKQSAEPAAASPARSVQRHEHRSASASASHESAGKSESAAPSPAIARTPPRHARSTAKASGSTPKKASGSTPKKAPGTPSAADYYAALGHTPSRGRSAGAADTVDNDATDELINYKSTRALQTVALTATNRFDDATTPQPLPLAPEQAEHFALKAAYEEPTTDVVTFVQRHQGSAKRTNRASHANRILSQQGLSPSSLLSPNARRKLRGARGTVDTSSLLPPWDKSTRVGNTPPHRLPDDVPVNDGPGTGHLPVAARGKRRVDEDSSDVMTSYTASPAKSTRAQRKPAPFANVPR